MAAPLSPGPPRPSTRRSVLDVKRNDVSERLRGPADGGGPQEVVARVKGTQKEVRLKVERELSCLVGPQFTEGPP